MMIPYPLAYMVGSGQVCNRMEGCSLHGDHGQHVCLPPSEYVGVDTSCSRMEGCSLHGDHSQHVCIQMTEGRHPPDATAAVAADDAAAAVAIHTIVPPVVEFNNGNLVPQDLIPSSISKSTQKTLDQYENNYRLFFAKA